MLAHLVLAIVAVLVWELTFDAVLGLAASPEVADLRSETSGYWRWLQAAMMYGVVVAGMVVVRTGRRLRLEERRASQLQLLMRESELRALRAQLRPHFLFNTLNSIYSLIPSRPKEATSMVAGLSDLMRETLEVTDQALVPLSTELRLVESYLEIESVRFGDRLEVVVEAEPGTEQALVPPLLLQPLVENAVRRGIAPLVNGGTIEVSARVLAVEAGQAGVQRLRLVVKDSGSGFEESGSPMVLADSSPGHGNGLRITRSRLENQYGEAFSLEMGAAAGSDGAVITIDLPLER